VDRQVEEHDRDVTSPKRLTASVPALALPRAAAAAALGISVDHFDRHVRDDLPVVYSGALRLYPVSGLQRWLDEQAVAPGKRVA
jgi:hypothetical protein